MLLSLFFHAMNFSAEWPLLLIAFYREQEAYIPSAGLELRWGFSPSNPFLPLVPRESSTTTMTIFKWARQMSERSGDTPRIRGSGASMSIRAEATFFATRSLHLSEGYLSATCFKLMLYQTTLSQQQNENSLGLLSIVQFPVTTITLYREIESSKALLIC